MTDLARHLGSLGAASVLTLLALGSLSGSDSSSDPEPVLPDAADGPADSGPPPAGQDTALPPEPVQTGAGQVDTAVFLDTDAATCKPGHTRVGAAPGPDVPWLPLPTLEPPPGFELDAMNTLDGPGVLGRPPGEGDLVRWCVDAEGTGQGPVVFSRLDGRFRIYGNLSDGKVDGTARGFSYTSDPPEQQERNVEELVLTFDQGELDGTVETTCPLQDMNAICPGAAGVTGTFQAGERQGPWTWSTFDGAQTWTFEVRYRTGTPSGTAQVVHDAMGCVCTQTGRVDAKGRQGAWRERCEGQSCGAQAADTTVKNWVDGEVR